MQAGEKYGRVRQRFKKKKVKQYKSVLSFKVSLYIQLFQSWKRRVKSSSIKIK